MAAKLIFLFLWMSARLTFSHEMTVDPFELLPINWGASIGSVQIGLLVQDVSVDKKTFHQCCIFTRNTNTNKHGRIYDALEYPKREEMFIPILRDSKGISVRKTVLGRRFGKAVSVRTDRSRSTLVHIDQEARQAYCFKLEDFFEIAKEGEYEIEITFRLLRNRGGSALNLIEFPSIQQKLKL